MVILSSEAFPLEPRALLQESDYYETLHDLFSQAEGSIDIVIDAIVITPLTPDNPVNKLIESLIEARKRGVKIRVILEDTRSPKNFVAYRSLLEGGIDVYFDTSKLLINSKAIVVDSHICIVGGLSWSPDAWRKNHTLSVVLDSEHMAGVVEDSVSKLLLAEQSPFIVEERPKGILIPNDLLLLKKFGMRFVDERAEEQFDLYLLLIKEAQAKSDNELLFDYEGWGRMLGLEKKFFREFESEEEKKEYYNRKVKKAARFLRDRFRLIEYDEENDKVVLLKQFNIDLSRPDAANPCFVLPDKFWDAEMPHRLDLNAKYVYLASLLEAEKSARYPYWFGNESTLSDMYGLNLNTVSAGLDQLEEMNLIEIARAPAVKDEPREKDKNVYRINRIISQEEFNEKILEFEQEYGRDITEQAQKEASELNEPNDLYIIKTFINLIHKYGYPAVRRANIDTLHYERGSNLRHISTTIKLLEKE